MNRDFCQLASLGWELLSTFKLAVVCTLGIFLSANANENWTSFQNGGEIQHAIDQSETYEIDWTVDLEGYGQSSPVAWDGQLYVTSVKGDNKETVQVSAFNATTGEQLWKHEMKNATPQESTNYVSKAAPTPVVDAKGVTAFFEGGNLVSLTHQGEVRWQRDLVKEYGKIESRHGLGASLEHSDNAVYVWVERSEEPYVLAVEKASGENIWKVEGLGTTSWASPRLIDVEGGQSLVLSGVGQLVGINPKTGDRQWTFDEITGNSTPTPIPVSQGKFLIGATVGRGDTQSGRAAKSNGIVQVKKDENGEWQVGYLWQSKRATSSFGSPIVADGLCYFVNRTGVMYCVDAETGDEKYAERVGGSIWATPIALTNKIVLPLKDGKLVVGTAGEKYKSLSELDILTKPESDEPFGGATLYAAILADSKLILRSGDKLYSLSSK